LSAHFTENAYEAKRLALEKVMLEEMEFIQHEAEGSGTGRGDAMAAGAQYFRAIRKVTGDVSRVEALTKMLSTLPAKTVKAALPGQLVYDIIEDTEKHLVWEIQKSYEVSTCLNLKLKNYMGRRPWNRTRLHLSCDFTDGDWVRKKVGISQVGVPMLPEERTLMRLQREYEEAFGMELGGDVRRFGQKRQSRPREVPAC
jgi:hypothetical protein